MKSILKFLWSKVSTEQGAILIGSILISLSILVSGGVIGLKNQQTVLVPDSGSTAQASPTPMPHPDVSLGHLPVKGSSDAKVAVIEFADLRCPFCDQFFKETEPQIIQDYVNTDKVKFAFRQYEFLGPASTTAGNAVECANEQGKFWPMHDYLYQNQPDESDTSMYTSDKLSTIASNLGMDISQFQNCLSSNKYAQNVNQDMNDGRSIGVTGTPTFFIGKLDPTGKKILASQMIVGAEPYATIKAVIDQQLAQ